MLAAILLPARVFAMLVLVTVVACICIVCKRKREKEKVMMVDDKTQCTRNMNWMKTMRESTVLMRLLIKMCSMSQIDQKTFFV